MSSLWQVASVPSCGRKLNCNIALPGGPDDSAETTRQYFFYFLGVGACLEAVRRNQTDNRIRTQQLL